MDYLVDYVFCFVLNLQGDTLVVEGEEPAGSLNISSFKGLVIGKSASNLSF